MIRSPRGRLTHRVDAVCSEHAGRATTFWLERGAIQTPCFMPVGTVGTVKGLSPDEVAGTGAPILLGNTYHLYLRPGTEVLRRYGGLHRFMDWQGPILTDSGGYQFFSLQKNTRADDEGVTFRSHLDGSTHRFTPTRVIEVQRDIDSDIMMVLDECPALPAGEALLQRAVQRTTRWAEQSLEAAEQVRGALFGIVQGGPDLRLRRAHLAELSGLPFDGLALGGMAVGEAPEEMHRTLSAVAPGMPANRPRYLMGVGRPLDLLIGVACGIDLFDCVMPTRNGRTGSVFTSRGRVNLRNGSLGGRDEPLDPACSCLACRRWSVGYLQHLMRTGEMLGPRLASLHNLTYYQRLMREARGAILAGRFPAFWHATLSGWGMDPVSEARVLPRTTQGSGGDALPTGGRT
jgi:queuine tRNA-ribosyltransferase